MRFRELKIDRMISVWAGFSLHVLTNHSWDGKISLTDARLEQVQ